MSTALCGLSNSETLPQSRIPTPEDYAPKLVQILTLFRNTNPSFGKTPKNTNVKKIEVSAFSCLAILTN